MEESISEIREALENADFSFDVSHLIMENRLPFMYSDKMYRVRMPLHYEKVMAEDLRNKKEVELLNSGGYVYKKQLKRILKEKQGIDIDALEIKKQEILDKIKDVYLQTAVVLSDNSLKIEELREKENTLKNELISISIESTTYLKTCIEDRTEKEAIEYLTACCTERLNGKNEWENVWNSYEDFKKETSGLTEKATEKFVSLLVNTRQ